MAVHETKGVGFFDNFPWILARLVVIGGDRQNFLAGELASQLLEFLLFRAQF
jgi:hypothetical protein